MAEFDPDQFITITFDIMEKVARQAVKVKALLREKYPNNPFQQKMDFQVEFREILRQFQSEMIDKYNLSFSEFNQEMMMYREQIDTFLAKHPDKFEKYWDIKFRLSIEEEKVKKYIESQKSSEKVEQQPSQEPEKKIPTKYPWGNTLPSDGN